MAQSGWKRALEYLGLAEPFDDDYEDLPLGDDGFDLDDDLPSAPRPEPSNVRRIGGEPEPVEPPPGPAASPAPPEPTGTVNVLSGGGGGGGVATMAPAGPVVADHVHVTSPVVFNDVEDVGRAFRDGTPVVMNLRGASDGDAKRLLDFASGLIYGLHGDIERHGNRVFMLVPADTDIAPDEMDRLRDRGIIA